jgi:hypothetical protein
MMARKKQSDLTNLPGLPPDYPEFLESLKVRVRQAQTQAMLSVNRELIRLYWEIGREIVQRQEQATGASMYWSGWRTTSRKPSPAWAGFPAATSSVCGRFILLT